MQEQLPQRQQKVLDTIVQHIRENGYPPTVREIGEAIGVKSTSLVSYYLKRLEERGLISREASMSRAITPTDKVEAWGGSVDETSNDVLAIPFLGYIVASEPIPVDPLPGTETVEISRALFGQNVKDLFALKVQGNSMIDALIHDGDTVILRHQQVVENGQMAAVWLKRDEETTLKKVYYEGKRVRLQPANPTMPPIYVAAEDVEIQGKVVLVIRRVG